MRLYIRAPWRMPPSWCESNARAVLVTKTREQPDGPEKITSAEVLVGSHDDKHWRRDLRLSVRGYDRPYFHVLVFWFHKGRYLKQFCGSWDRFRSAGVQVDHGTASSEGPHVLDWRTLSLLPGEKNAAQSQLQRQKYAAHGGLKRTTQGGPHLDLKKARRRMNARTRARPHTIDLKKAPKRSKGSVRARPVTKAKIKVEG